ESWYQEKTAFFDVERTRAWVLLRRLTHSAHHRAQLTVYLRLLGHALYSTYGPTADTGGLFQNKADVIYRYSSVEELIASEEAGGLFPALPGPGTASPTERPARR
ncbi:MAG: DinB family protein, partial [Acidithiobacillales bacterium]